MLSGQTLVHLFSQCPQWTGGVNAAFPPSSQEWVGVSLPCSVSQGWIEQFSSWQRSTVILNSFAILLPKCLRCFSLTSWWKWNSPLDTVHDVSNTSFLLTLVLVHLVWD